MMSQLFALSDQETICGKFLWWSFPISFLEKDHIIPWMLNTELKFSVIQFCASFLILLAEGKWRKGASWENEMERPQMHFRLKKNNTKYWKLTILNNVSRNFIMNLAAIWGCFVSSITILASLVLLVPMPLVHTALRIFTCLSQNEFTMLNNLLCYSFHFKPLSFSSLFLSWCKIYKLLITFKETGRFPMGGFLGVLNISFIFQAWLLWCPYKVLSWQWEWCTQLCFHAFFNLLSA